MRIHIKKKVSSIFLLVRFPIDNSVKVDFEKICVKILKGNTRISGRGIGHRFYRIRQFFSSAWTRRDIYVGETRPGVKPTNPPGVENKIAYSCTSSPPPTFKMCVIHLGNTHFGWILNSWFFSFCYFNFAYRRKPMKLEGMHVEKILTTLEKLSLDGSFEVILGRTSW